MTTQDQNTGNVGVTAAKGFRAAGVTAGIKASGTPDLALVVNDGPRHAAAGVFTSNRVHAAPVKWSRQVLNDGELAAVILNSGGANACTGPEGFQDTHATAEKVAAELGIGAIEVAVCSTGLIGVRLPMDKLLPGVELAVEALSDTGGESAAIAIKTTDTVHKTAQVTAPAGWTVGGMAKGAGMLAPGLATMLVVVTTDAVVDSAALDAALRDATRTTFDRVDSDGCMSTNDTVLLLASGASEVAPEQAEFAEAVRTVCADLARQLIGDAEGASKDIRIDVVNAATEDEAVDVARTISRSNLLKCAIHGEDPNWGRVLSAIGTTSAAFDPDRLDVAINGVWVCRDGGVGEDRDLVSMKDREVVITADLKAGQATASIWTNDLTAEYVHENSAYSS
ncbi:bifunctional glutamate N-acetyltransferase/amino-acid acetyltransferase ArgJ [Kitasatospora sp. YST-16]|uniref:bifunctional glutamate N-acetyltransferase/amino-acid acetyltransferase ArgJ n=1 Tax=Kitasatospora sp. YST-16 TaxID=2998080 RepID=UPI0022838A8B|nr:bifunctional glutamate N-acetyltransferase/amino-acid acetyltransferase ArgJ [Kitasatospora sp. YST-16]WAL70845.1 bifunctional glutamate N-acetyltransferase/amino-acid acetyltransferase ArgJ [Kitasatospora sp. YST-16]WNW36880.1 bifunctional glutamate N-acetyltransferase/amino-acid acetyltransferase ArgJ [Streptomyces sp. Li-HN-5-13]